MNWQTPRELEQRLEVLKQNGCIVEIEPFDYIRTLDHRRGIVSPPYDWALEDE